MDQAEDGLGEDVAAGRRALARGRDGRALAGVPVRGGGAGGAVGRGAGEEVWSAPVSRAASDCPQPVAPSARVAAENRATTTTAVRLAGAFRKLMDRP
ncbi:hypothetical protein ACFSSF_00690 [Dietzia aerolata]|uniref:hypothetical protein n=1 Tax=Dietzia aerolata TaxID=595984 RepID=UPI00363BE02A